MKVECIKLSLILPVYNVKDYICECLDSICGQVESACEVVLVDDGATDGSGLICDAYAERYDYIRVIHKENGGLSSARNAGLEVARGQYIAFVDSDDRLAPNCIREILAWIDSGDGDTDICFMQIEKFYPDGYREDMGDNISKDRVVGRDASEVMGYLASRPKYPGSAVSKLYRYAFLKENQLHFPYDCRYSEDLGFTRDCLMKAQKFDALHIPYYEYRKNREGSITSARVERNFWDLTLFVTESVEMLTVNKRAEGHIGACIMSFVAYEYSILLWYCSTFTGDAKQTAYDFLKKYQWVLRYGTTWKLKGIRTIASLIGLPGASRLLDCYMKLRVRGI